MGYLDAFTSREVLDFSGLRLGDREAGAFVVGLCEVDWEIARVDQQLTRDPAVLLLVPGLNCATGGCDEDVGNGDHGGG